MKPEDINRAIAELCGWTVTHDAEWSLDAMEGFTERNSAGVPIMRIVPNYHASLDACREFEGTLKTDEERDAYGEALWSVMFPKSSAARYYDFFDGEIACDCATTTAPQRCEAFLRVHGRYVE